LISRQTAGTGGIDLTGYEMLKGLSGVESHLHRERLPVLPNDQDRRALAGAVAELLEGDRTLHGFLLEAHGLYTWGRDLSEARRHLEVLEFLLEVESRLPDAGFRPGGA
ncbi:MAG: class II aldolase/adducin family protein, partial [Acidobacteriota bacterium]